MHKIYCLLRMTSRFTHWHLILCTLGTVFLTFVIIINILLNDMLWTPYHVNNILLKPLLLLLLLLYEWCMKSHQQSYHHKAEMASLETVWYPFFQVYCKTTLMSADHSAM